MFCQWVIILLPSIQPSVAQETCCVVGVALVGLVVETCMRQLQDATN